jgi:hypothetical protein
MQSSVRRPTPFTIVLAIGFLASLAAPHAQAGNIDLIAVPDVPLDIRAHKSGLVGPHHGDDVVPLEFILSGSRLIHAKAVTFQAAVHVEDTDTVYFHSFRVELAPYSGDGVVYMSYSFGDVEIAGWDSVEVFPIGVEFTESSWKLADELKTELEQRTHTAGMLKDNQPPIPMPEPDPTGCASICAGHHASCRTGCANCDSYSSSCTCSSEGVTTSCSCSGCNRS